MTRFYGFGTPANPPGRMIGTASPDGATTAYAYTQYGSQWLLSAMTDDYGRATAYEHALAAGRWVLSEVTDYAGRRTTLQYDSAGNLAAVVGPSVTKGAGGGANTFPGGTAYAFDYDLTGPRPRVSKVYFPKQVAPYLHPVTRAVDLASVYAHATPRHVVTCGTYPMDPAAFGRVAAERVLPHPHLSQAMGRRHFETWVPPCDVCRGCDG